MSGVRFSIVVIAVVVVRLAVARVTSSSLILIGNAEKK